LTSKFPELTLETEPIKARVRRDFERYEERANEEDRRKIL